MNPYQTINSVSSSVPKTLLMQHLAKYARYVLAVVGKDADLNKFAEAAEGIVES